MTHVRRPGRKNGEEGIFLVLAAVLALALIVSTFIFVLDITRLKQSGQQLRLFNEKLCQAAAENPILQSRGVAAYQELFRQFIDGSDGNGGPLLKISKTKFIATLVMPTTTADDGAGGSLAGYDLLTPPADCGSSDKSPFNADFSGTIPSAVCSGCTVEFHFKSDFCDPDGLAWYPTTMGTRVGSGGNFVGCELKAEVPLFGLSLLNPFRTNDQLVARSVWARPLRVKLDPNPSGPTTPPPLTIAIGTEVGTTAVVGDRFSFSGSFSPQGTAGGASSYSSTFWSRYAPFQEGDGITPRAEAFGGPKPPVIYPPAMRDASSTDIPADQTHLLEYTPPGNWDTAGRRELLTACMNPLVLVRNTFLQVITELASRNQELRNNTEILHLNPQNIPADPSDVPVPNRPTLLVQGGGAVRDDLTDKSYQLPFVQYDTSILFGGWLNPLGSQTGLGLQHSFLSSQLRMCYSLFDGAANIGIDRFAEFLQPAAELDNAGFENPNRYPVSVFNLWKMSYTAGKTWDQETPWCNGDDFACAQNDTRRLSAAELVAALGTTQLCPVTDGIPTSAGGYETACAKGTAVTELRPDYRGLAKYFTDQTAGAEFGAYKSPGLFDFTQYPPASGALPYGPATRTSVYAGGPGGTRRHLLVVMHRPPTPLDSAELAAIFAKDTGVLADMTVTVAYFPSTLSDASDVSIDRIKTAFAIPATISSTDLLANALYVFSPYSEQYNGDAPDHAVGKNWENYPIYFTPATIGTNDDWAFRSYWYYLLFAGQDTNENIVRAATAIFVKRILRSELRL